MFSKESNITMLFWRKAQFRLGLMGVVTALHSDRAAPDRAAQDKIRKIGRKRFFWKKKQKLSPTGPQIYDTSDSFVALLII